MILMSIKPFTLSLCFALALLSLASCKKTIENPMYASNGLYANKVYHADSIVHDHGMRMFTQAGEIHDVQVIDQYLALHPIFSEQSTIHPEFISNNNTNTVYLNGLYPHVATLHNGAINLKQSDTSWSRGSGTVKTTEIMYNWKLQLQAMTDAVLEKNGSYSKVVRVDDSTYEQYESHNINGTYLNETIAIPYTFVASRYQFDSYPFAVKPSPAPQVQAGDTLLVYEGTVSFRPKN